MTGWVAPRWSPLSTAEMVASKKTESAGRYLFTGSPALMCMAIAPTMSVGRLL